MKTNSPFRLSQQWGTPSLSESNHAGDRNIVSAPPRYEDVVQVDVVEIDDPTVPGAIPLAETSAELRMFLVTDTDEDITVVDEETSQSLAEQSSADVTVVDADLSRRLADKSRSA